MQVPETKKEFLQSSDPLTLFCFVDLSGNTSKYELVHPRDEETTRAKGLAENPEHIYLYIRNGAARDYIGVYGAKN